MQREFIPIILGTDTNVYGVASSFHQKYGISSVAIGMRHQIYTDNLKFLNVYTYKDFNKSDIFKEKLVEFAQKKKYQGKKLLLISCSDYYTELLSNNKEELANYYEFNVIDPALRSSLENKMDFYKTCEIYNLDYPDTFVISKENYKEFTLPFDFPVIAKPNDSIKYFSIDFEGYKKAYKLDSYEDLKEVLNKVYTNGYDDFFIIQDFIPGGVETMYVVNAYSDKNGVVRMTSAARTALDECLPNDIGNYNALITGEYLELTEAVKKFLEKINYQGYSNFDFKYDHRDKKFKVFEINLRQGRSSYYMTASGNNFVEYIVNDLILDKNKDYYNHTKEHLWYYTAKSVLKKYTPNILLDDVKRLLLSNQSTFSLDYYANSNLKRWLLRLRRKLSTIKYYPKYMNGEA